MGGNIGKGAEAEYRGATVEACEAVWLKRILKDLDVSIKDAIILCCDNMSNIHLTQNPKIHAQTKHIEVHYHFIRERCHSVLRTLREKRTEYPIE